MDWKSYTTESIVYPQHSNAAISFGLSHKQEAEERVKRYRKGQWSPREWRLGFDGIQHGEDRHEVSERVKTKSPSQVRTHYQKVKYTGVVSLGSEPRVEMSNGVKEMDASMMEMDSQDIKLTKRNGPWTPRETYLAVYSIFQWGLKLDKIEWCLGTRSSSDLLDALAWLKTLAKDHGFKSKFKLKRTGSGHRRRETWPRKKRKNSEENNKPQKNKVVVPEIPLNQAMSSLSMLSKSCPDLKIRQSQMETTNTWQTKFDFVPSPATPPPCLFPELGFIHEVYKDEYMIE
mmetsp:Transcript_29415/g.32707  ORF Transcript_29415/g.32707 Transcript_29415/m.32707 type:complete len:288 (-) Transcript_29415:155-1018(-)|eukprot:CAMPEP_0168535634 /NCGR_PEP_ID=MMETSP0405-20121227/18872_1 /TAXON_ID=498012 /ORGANISM="Trichosphaerium sp, Strain Am-I-7 wt" /LENGTH=287 /DNA_ID=CAMNT_0008563089 /DNA_START=88 /DNA_END=951 /DNA_ORIENTATION=-